MDRELVESLRQKGWAEKDIQKAVGILYNADGTLKESAISGINKTIYWIVLLITIVGNLLVSVVLIPFLLILKSVSLFAVISVLALSFGFLFHILIRDIQKIDYEHRVLAYIFIPVFAELNILVVLQITKSIGLLIDSNVVSNSLLINFVYVIVFTLPYVFDRFFLQQRTNMLHNHLKKGAI